MKTILSCLAVLAMIIVSSSTVSQQQQLNEQQTKAISTNTGYKSQTAAQLHTAKLLTAKK